MPRLTSRDFAAFRVRVNKLLAHIDETLALRGSDAKPKELMITVSSVCVNLSAAFDFGDSIRNRIQPGLLLRSMKASSIQEVRAVRDEACAILEAMRDYMQQKLTDLEKEMAGGR